MARSRSALVISPGAVVLLMKRLAEVDGQTTPAREREMHCNDLRESMLLSPQKYAIRPTQKLEKLKILPSEFFNIRSQVTFFAEFEQEKVVF